MEEINFSNRSMSHTCCMVLVVIFLVIMSMMIFWSNYSKMCAKKILIVNKNE